jgi:hypothetical protein
MERGEDPDDDDRGPGRAGPLAAVMILIALAVAGFWLVSVLRQQSAIGDCLLARRSNCDALVR